MRNCIDEGTLQAWFDGELAAPEAAQVAAHLGSCGQCAEVAHSVEAENLILSEGLSTEFAAAIPTERLRQRIDGAIAKIHHAPVRSARRPRRRLLSEFFASFRPLAYASMAAILLLGGFVVFVYLKKEKTTPVTVRDNAPQIVPATPKEPGEQLPTPVPSKSPQTVIARRTQPVRRTSVAEPDATSLSWQERQYEYAIAKLNEAIKIEPPMRPSIRVEYEYDMAVIDNAIATSRDVARKKAKDPQATQAMLDAYQSKVDLMNQIANARGPER